MAVERAEVMGHREGLEPDTFEERSEGRGSYFTREGCLWGCLLIAVAAVLLWVLAAVILFDADSIPPPG